MKLLQCLVADDEPIARQILATYIESTPNLALAAACKDAFEVMEVLEKQKIDILFLDINMPKLSGISLLKVLKDPPEVIITSAYPEYAIEGFELSVTDYLLKPFSLERFVQAVLKVQKKNKSQSIESSGKNKDESPTSIFVKSDKKRIRIPFDTINYIESFGNYIKIYTDKMVLSPHTLSDFYQKLPENDFFRIHKSLIINFTKLKEIEGNQVVLINGSKLPIGKSFRSAVIKKTEEM